MPDLGAGSKDGCLQVSFHASAHTWCCCLARCCTSAVCVCAALCKRVEEVRPRLPHARLLHSAVCYGCSSQALGRARQHTTHACHCCLTLPRTALPLRRWPYTASMQYVGKAVWAAQQARVQRQLQGVGPTGSSSAPAPGPVSGGSGVMGHGSRGNTAGPAGGLAVGQLQQ